jgi:hypothetical protein
MAVRSIGAAAGLALGLTALGCISIPLPISLPQLPATGREEVRRNAEVFGDNFQWGRLAEASRLVHPDDRVAFLEHGTELEERLRVTGFEIATVEVDGSEAWATVVFRIYRPPSVVEQTLIDRQHWERKTGAWYLRPALDRY